MLLNNLRFSERVKLNLVSKLFPVKSADILLLDKIEIDLKETNVTQVNVPPLALPQITDDFSLANTESEEFNTKPSYTQIINCNNNNCRQLLRLNIYEQIIGSQLSVTCPTCRKTFLYAPTGDELIADFTAWLKDQLFYPDIKSFSMLLDKPRNAGKAYRQSTEKEQSSLFDTEDDDKDCIHGLKKSWCSICTQKEKHKKETASSQVDLFDLIFPILQPPLGENFDSPIAFPYDLYPFQRNGVKFLAENERALLADEMGLGKSIQTIVAIRFLFRKGDITNGLILCPKSLLTDWEKKLWDWAPEIRVVKVRGTKEQRQISWNTPSHLYLTTYETLRQDISNSLGNSESEDVAKKEFDIAILDEIQKIKNPSADVTKATRQLIARRSWGLSGTPLENRVEELISIFAYLKPGLLHYDDAARPLKVKEAIKPYFLRRRKVDVLDDLPAKNCDEVWLELSAAQREAYDRAEKEGVIALNEQGDSVTVQHVLALITKLKQICNLEPVSKESCKLEYLIEQLQEITEQDDKALVFSQYPDKTLKSIEPELSQFSPLVYHGMLSESQRDRIIDEFQNKDDCKALLMSVKAGGLGLTLTRANFVFHFDLWWNPSVAAQAEDRAHRIGQKKPVYVTSLFTVNTIEEKIQTLLKRKRELFASVIDDLSDTNLSVTLAEDELFGLFNLQKGKHSDSKKSASQKSSAELLSRISPQQFENLISVLYEKMGYHVKLTPQTRDKGIDIYAKRLYENGTEVLAIQCKHYPKGTVGVEHARALYGVIHAQPSITKGILLTSGSFSRDCKEFVDGKRIELFDVNIVCGLLEKYDVSFEAT
jgi:HJR/Mrr/RecB family endonuclease